MNRSSKYTKDKIKWNVVKREFCIWPREEQEDIVQVIAARQGSRIVRAVPSLNLRIEDRCHVSLIGYAFVPNDVL